MHDGTPAVPRSLHCSRSSEFSGLFHAASIIYNHFIFKEQVFTVRRLRKQKKQGSSQSINHTKFTPMFAWPA